MTGPQRPRQGRPNIQIQALCTRAFGAAILFAAQVGLSFLPNIELVTLLVVLYVQVWGKKAFFPIYLFVLLEGLFFGFGIWWVSYLYIWAIPAFLALLLRTRSPVFWALINGAFGLCFGALCALPYLVAGGPGAVFGYFVSGIPYDIAHCAGNAVLCLVLYRPLQRILERAAPL